MTANPRNLSYVATLQDLGRPYSLLFIDKENLNLFILVRGDGPENNKFIAAEVTSDDVKNYLNDNVGIIDLFSRHKIWNTFVKEDEFTLSELLKTPFRPTERMQELNKFNPELCDDDAWIEIFLNRIDNNLPIEIA